MKKGSTFLLLAVVVGLGARPSEAQQCSGSTCVFDGPVGIGTPNPIGSLEVLNGFVWATRSAGESSPAGYFAYHRGAPANTGTWAMVARQEGRFG